MRLCAAVWSVSRSGLVLWSIGVTLLSCTQPGSSGWYQAAGCPGQLVLSPGRRLSRPRSPDTAHLLRSCMAGQSGLLLQSTTPPLRWTPPGLPPALIYETRPYLEPPANIVNANVAACCRLLRQVSAANCCNHDGAASTVGNSFLSHCRASSCSASRDDASPAQPLTGGDPDSACIEPACPVRTAGAHFHTCALATQALVEEEARLSPHRLTAPCIPAARTQAAGLNTGRSKTAPPHPILVELGHLAGAKRR
jgi:hypothetical protein